MNNVVLKEIIIRSIPDSIEFDSIILFGSHARNNNNENSDYDLLIVLKKKITQHEKIKLSTIIRRNLALNLIDADIIVKHTDEIDYYKSKPGSIVKNALKEGILL